MPPNHLLLFVEPLGHPVVVLVEQTARVNADSRPQVAAEAIRPFRVIAPLRGVVLGARRTDVELKAQRVGNLRCPGDGRRMAAQDRPDVIAGQSRFQGRARRAQAGFMKAAANDLRKGLQVQRGFSMRDIYHAATDRSAHSDSNSGRNFARPGTGHTASPGYEP